MAFYQELPTSFQSALTIAERILSRSGELVRRGVVSSEAEQIVRAAYQRAAGKPLGRAELFARLGDRFPAEAGERVVVWAGARSEGRLLQHLLGFQAFIEHDYRVGPEVLVPRPETELLVAHAIEKLRAAYGEELRLGFEIGAGSGAISIELLHAFPRLTMIASELTEGAALCAASNAQRILGSTERLKLVLASDPLSVWKAFGARQAQFLISNPPYLDPTDPIDEEVLRYEPRSALFAAGDDPSYFYREIAREASRHLVPGALVFVEIPPERADLISGLFKAASMQPDILKDLHGRQRMISAKVGS